MMLIAALVTGVVLGVILGIGGLIAAAGLLEAARERKAHTDQSEEPLRGAYHFSERT